MRVGRVRSGTVRVFVAVAVVAVVVPGCAARRYRQVSCAGSDQSIFLLEAQAVPSATLIPCIAPLPVGWSYGGSSVRSGLARFWLSSDRAGFHAVEVTLRPICDVSTAVRVPLAPGAPARLRRYDEPVTMHPYSAITYYLFAGGCVTYRLSFTADADPSILDQANRLLAFTPRSVYVRGVRKDAGLTLCGAEARPCAG